MTESLLVKHFDDLLSTSEDAEQLSNTILQLALQGKLGTQDSNDEPASEILKRIRSSRADSEKELPVREDEIPFPLPNGWEWVRLPEVTDNWGQKKPDKQFTYIDVSSIDNQFGVVGDELAILNPEDAPSRARKIVKEGCVIYSTVRPYLLNIAIIDRDIQPEPIVSTAFYVMNPVEGLDAKFLYLYLRSKYFTKFVESQMTGMAYPAISDGKMSLGIIPLPPLAEQQRIVARVEELFVQTRALAKELAHSQIELDGLNKSALSHLLASETPEEFNQHWDFIAEHFDLLFQTPEHVAPLRQSILELALRGKLTRREEGDEHASELLRQIRAEKADLKDGGKLTKAKESNVTKLDEQLYNIPEGWIWCRINDTGAAINNAIVDGPFGSNLVLSDYDDLGEYPVISISNIDHGFDLAKLRKINQKKYEELKRSSIYPGDLLVAKIGSSWGKVGMYPMEMPIGIIPANLLKITVNSKLSKDYVRYFLRSKTQRTQLEKLVKFTAQPAFNVTAFKQLLFPLPPLAEQERIVKRVEQLLSLCDALEARLQSAEEERGRLVAAVMSTVGGSDGE